jgi:hypothetical protein
LARVFVHIIIEVIHNRVRLWVHISDGCVSRTGPLNPKLHKGDTQDLAACETDSQSSEECCSGASLGMGPIYSISGKSGTDPKIPVFRFEPIPRRYLKNQGSDESEQAPTSIRCCSPSEMVFGGADVAEESIPH